MTSLICYGITLEYIYGIFLALNTEDFLTLEMV